MKKLTLILLSILMIVTLVACGDKECEHIYDNACATTCNKCGEERTITHDFAAADCFAPKTCTTCGATEGSALEHTWVEADCENAKTCKVCGSTDGYNLGHTYAEDDGDCTTEWKCPVCGEVLNAAKTEHIACADDGDCTTPVTCSACTTVLTAAKSHDFKGDLEKDSSGHWYVCQNENCTQEDTKQEHNKGEDGKCTVCGYVIEESTHEHTYDVKKSDETYHWIACVCGAEKPDSREEHSVTSDNDCTTPDLCACGYTVTAAINHLEGENDGNCMTAVKCSNDGCEQNAVAAYANHVDSDGDHTCDNPGCQLTIDAPKDTNDGIDLPIDTNG